MADGEGAARGAAFETTFVLGRPSLLTGYGLVGKGGCFARDVLANVPASTYVVFTDANLADLGHLESLVRSLREESAAVRAAGEPEPRVLEYVLPPGEESKSRRAKEECEDFLLASACSRDTCLVALGGGVVGDLVGFVAATFMRGVRYVQVPTTLLAMVDSAIGGKTAVDTPRGKNLIGAFWQPERIFADLSFLKTLPPREFANGMAEVIKTAAFWDEKMFTTLESEVESITEGATSDDASCRKLLHDVILAAARVKAHVVTVDERETGLRGLLNFGHTVGHAYEALLFPALLHGECVSIGMVKEAEIARRLGHLHQAAVSRLVRCLRAYGLPVTIDDERVAGLTGGKRCAVEDLMRTMDVDKKNCGSRKKVVLPAGIGKTVEQRASFVPDDCIRNVLSPAVVVRPPSTSERPRPPDVVICTPGSKSVSNRALLLASLGTGTCRLKGLLHSDDTQVMLDALRRLGGSSYSWEDGGDTLVVTGCGGKFHVPDRELYLGNAGTAARFVTTVCALVEPAPAGSLHTATVLTGNARMKQRPIGPLVDALRENGQQVEYLQSESCLPIRVIPSHQGLAGGEIRLEASISSQYVSSILMCAPYARESVVLRLVGGAVVSQPYIDMTVAMMRSFGIEVERVEENAYRIPRGEYRNPAEYVVEPDASSATYPLALAAITGTKVTIPNIGSRSLQGDARFAVEVLRPMGCDVTQTETSTTVQGPPVGSLKPIPHVDMEPMTDAFLTASVLAAVASSGDGVTRITGIANQRVKECNRIAAMVHELAKFGVRALELPDGIEITGRPVAELRAPRDGVHCYDDHRVAMSFSVLGCVAPGGTMLREKKCVEKTWPTWWDDLERLLGIETAGEDIVRPPLDVRGAAAGGAKPLRTSLDLPRRKPADPSASIILIGMRGAGKSHLGRAAARHLGFKFVDLDLYFEAATGVPLKRFVTDRGWKAFRDEETRILLEVLEREPSGAVIACGGGIVETTEARDALVAYVARSGGRVVHIRRDLHAIQEFLSTDPTRPSYTEEVSEVWRRRRPWYERCAAYEFSVLPGLTDLVPAWSPADWKLIEADLCKMLSFITVRPPLPLPDGAFVSLTVPDVARLVPDLASVSVGADAMELRVDLLRDASFPETEVPEVEYVRRQLGVLRRHSDLPIIFTVRTKAQGGRFPDDRQREHAALLEKGLEWGCEYVDAEITLPDGALRRLSERRGNARIIASWHDLAGVARRSGEVVKRAAKFGDIVKMVGTARTLVDNFPVRESAREEGGAVESLMEGKPAIVINMGAEGQLSRCLNRFLTPATHPALPTKAAPGQLSVAEINTARHLIGLLPARKYFLFGCPIAQSPSPALHNAGFRALALPHVYALYETGDAANLEPVMRSAEFGGASVTIPHKVDVAGMMDSVSPAARAIGAVNTVVAVDGPGGRTLLFGDNTDWLGIHDCVARKVGGDLAALRGEDGLVIGAGGTARAAVYALKELGLRTVRIWNRTYAKAADVARELGAEAAESLDLLAAPAVVVATVPAEAQEPIREALRGLFERAAAGAGGARQDGETTPAARVAVEMAYRPTYTPFALAASNKGYSLETGLGVLVAQGLRQFEIWTGKRPPAETMERAATAFFECRADDATGKGGV